MPTIELQIFSPRWGHADTYEIELERNHMEITRGVNAARADWQDNADPTWSGWSVEGMMGMTASIRLPSHRECSRGFGRPGEVVRSTPHRQKRSSRRLLTGSMRLRALSRELTSGGPTSSS